MKKQFVIILLTFSILPFTACVDGDSNTHTGTTLPTATQTQTTTKRQAVFNRNEKQFTLKDGIYTRVVGDTALFLVVEDPVNIEDNEVRETALAAMGDYPEQGYRCVAMVTKADTEEGTVNFSEKTAEDSIVRVYSEYENSVSSMSFNRKSRTIDEYVQMQIAYVRVTTARHDK